MIGYVLKTLWRHRTRTLLTVSGAAVAMFVFCFVGSVQEGLERLTTGSDAERSLIVFSRESILPNHQSLTGRLCEEIFEVPGVRDVMPIQVVDQQLSRELDIIVSTERSSEDSKVTSAKMLTGSWEQFRSQRDAAIVGRSIATREV